MAAGKGRKETVALLLAKGAYVNAENRWGGTPLLWTAGNPTKEVAELLLSKGASMDVFSAAALGQVDWIKSQFQTNKNLAQECDGDGRTGLHWAADHGQSEVVKVFFANKADPSVRDKYGWTPLHCAALSGHKETASVLIANHANVNARAKDGRTPLRLAVWKGHAEVADFLKHCGAKE